MKEVEEILNMLKKRSNLVPNIYDDRKPHNFRFLY